MILKGLRYDVRTGKLEETGHKTSTITNITSLRIEATSANGIGTGSKFVLMRLKRT